MTKFSYKQRKYQYHTQVNGGVSVSDQWVDAAVWADHVDVTEYGTLRFYVAEEGIIAAEPPHAWCELRREA